jgi:hypothetical protein
MGKKFLASIHTSTKPQKVILWPLNELVRHKKIPGGKSGLPLVRDAKLN